MSPPSPSRPSADRNLLFGILALQMDFISRDALVNAMNAWVMEKSKPLRKIFLEQGALRADAHDLLEALVDKHLELHGNDAEKSLASMSSLDSLRQALKQIGDPDLEASLAQVSAAQPANGDPHATLVNTVGTPTSSGSRFRILRPHAQGGLGRVSVALDEELRREVALKEIQDRHAHDPASRARFLLEAEVTGALEHPGIVPVYGLGAYADGRPFYAMRFIKGDSLKDAITRFHEADERDAGRRRLALRELLGRFIDVCNAIAYAHSRGVLHRDLKPGNIMLGKYGETLVVDWGLAKAVGRREGQVGAEERTLHPTSAHDSAPTQLGTALGTPVYMSPEQAAGRHDQLGPASDVYSLGATLYTLLTGKPPFEEKDLGTLLEKVQRGDFLPPRQIKPEVPRPLEAICLKAMAPKSDDRYPTAAALAADLEHWLADEPVAAYREPWTGWLRRWGRRHRPVVAAAGALLLTALVALSVSTVLIGQSERAAQSARQLAEEQQRAAESAREQAEQQRDRADRNLRLARAAVDKTVSQITENPRLKQADFHQLRHDLLQYLVPFYEEFVKQQANEPEVEAERGRAWFSLALLRQEMWQNKASMADYKQIRAIFAKLAAHFPEIPEYRQALAASRATGAISSRVWASRGRRKRPTARP
jgi:serine/threonine-protein kinase